MDLDELYQELILDHYKHPRCHGELPEPSKRVELLNPLCGDQIVLTVQIRDGIIEDIAFSGHGCSISQATASLMAERVKGKTVEEARKIAQIYRQMMRGEADEPELVQLGDTRAMEGVRKFSARIKCALLAWDCIERSLGSEGTKN